MCYTWTCLILPCSTTITLALWRTSFFASSGHVLSLLLSWRWHMEKSLSPSLPHWKCSGKPKLEKHLQQWLGLNIYSATEVTLTSWQLSFEPLIHHTTAFLLQNRRFIWNFFRLENEHINNCGKFRAVRDISIIPMDASDQAQVSSLLPLTGCLLHYLCFFPSHAIILLSFIPPPWPPQFSFFSAVLFFFLLGTLFFSDFNFVCLSSLIFFICFSLVPQFSSSTVPGHTHFFSMNVPSHPSFLFHTDSSSSVSFSPSSLPFNSHFWCLPSL